MKVNLSTLFALVLVACESQAEPPTSIGTLEIGRTAVDYGAAIGPAGEYAKALFSPEDYPAEQRAVVGATIKLENGTAVQDLTLFLFPVGEEGPELILGTGGGLLTAGNPKAATDADGKLTLTTGPLWRFTDCFTLGLLQQRSPDRPFDLAVLPVSDEDGIVTFEVSEQEREIELGTILLRVSGLDPIGQGLGDAAAIQVWPSAR